MQGTVDAAVTCVQSLKPKLARQGLKVNANKCRVYSANAELAVETATRLGLGPDCVAADGLVIAGTPIGKPEFVTEHAHARVGRTNQAITDLLSLGLSAQEKFVILHQCLQHRDTHLMRTTPWPQVQPALDRLENSVIGAIQRIAGIGAAEFQLHHRQQMQLPLRAGGFGVVVFDEQRANAAFLAGAALAQTALEHAPARFQPLQGDSAQALWDKFSQVVACYPEACKYPTAPREHLVLHTLPTLQTTVNKAACHRVLTRLLDGFTQDAQTLASLSARELALMECARLRSYACSEATIWLKVIPSSPKLELDSAEWRVGARAQLGLCALPSYDSADTLVRCFCSRVTTSTPCRHAQSCSVLSKIINSRHSYFVSAWRDICACAGLTTSWEPRVRDYLLDTDAIATPSNHPPPLPAPAAAPMTAPAPATGAEPVSATHRPLPTADATAPASATAPARPQTQSRAPRTATRGDFMIALPGQPPVMADVGITSVYRDGVLTASATQTGFAAAQYASRKHAHYRAAGASYCQHVPIIHEASGRLGNDGWQLLKRVAAFAAADRAVSKAEFIQAHLGRLGVVNTRALFRLVRAYTPVHARLSGSAILPGLPVPTSDVDALDV